jgi:hypothetical protein
MLLAGKLSKEVRDLGTTPRMVRRGIFLGTIASFELAILLCISFDITG